MCVCVCFRRLTVKHTRTLQLGEDVLCVKISPNQRLLAVALLDSTVKVFYMDTLKVYSPDSFLTHTHKVEQSH